MSIPHSIIELDASLEEEASRPLDQSGREFLAYLGISPDAFALEATAYNLETRLIEESDLHPWAGMPVG